MEPSVNSVCCLLRLSRATFGSLIKNDLKICIGIMQIDENFTYRTFL